MFTLLGEPRVLSVWEAQLSTDKYDVHICSTCFKRERSTATLNLHGLILFLKFSLKGEIFCLFL